MSSFITRANGFPPLLSRENGVVACMRSRGTDRIRTVLVHGFPFPCDFLVETSEELSRQPTALPVISARNTETSEHHADQWLETRCRTSALVDASRCSGYSPCCQDAAAAGGTHEPLSSAPAKLVACHCSLYVLGLPIAETANGPGITLSGQHNCQVPKGVASWQAYPLI